MSDLRTDEPKTRLFARLKTGSKLSFGRGKFDDWCDALALACYPIRPKHMFNQTSVFTVPKGIKKICEESRWCYVYEQYNATIVLSRSIIETILKDKLGRNKIRNLNAKQIIDHAAYKEIISENVSGEAHNIRKQANEILHKAKVATRQEAKSALDYILIFLQEIYFV